jgi:hypothetical protein
MRFKVNIDLVRINHDLNIVTPGGPGRESPSFTRYVTGLVRVRRETGMAKRVREIGEGLISV